MNFTPKVTGAPDIPMIAWATQSVTTSASGSGRFASSVLSVAPGKRDTVTP